MRFLTAPFAFAAAFAAMPFYRFATCLALIALVRENWPRTYRILERSSLS